MSEIRCPACNSILKSFKSIPLHTSKCKAWNLNILGPVEAFNWDLYFKRNLYADGQIENKDYVICQVCKEEGIDLRKRRLIDHIQCRHNLTEDGYIQKYPHNSIRLDATYELRKNSVQEHYGVDNVFQSEEIKKQLKETMVEKYGVDNPLKCQAIREAIKKTNLERYGVENPFASEVIKEKIRLTSIERYGVDNPNKSSLVREKTKTTIRNKHGVDYYYQSKDFKTKTKGTCLERYDADHHMKSDIGRKRYIKKSQELLGSDYAFTSKEIRQKAYENNLTNHGGKHSQQCPEILAKAKVTWLEKYGVDNPSKCDLIKEKIKEVWLAKYGVPFPPQSLFINKEGPNKLEQLVDSLSPYYVVYAGDGSYWVRCKGSTRSRNPDFVVLGDEQFKRYLKGEKLNNLRTSATIEVFGDYWHSEKFTGMDRKTHEQDVINYYKRAGIDCLVLWEGNIHRDSNAAKKKITKFLNDWMSETLLFT